MPNALAGGPRSTVIVRRGIIANMSRAEAGTSKSFLIDGSVFPGNSGGPVVTRPMASGIAGTKIPDRAWLIGIVASYVPYEDVAISQQTGQPRIVFSENSGLTNVFPVDSIEAAIEQFNIEHPLPDVDRTLGEVTVAEPGDDDQMATPEVLDLK